ncbi:MAG: hypothetical protein QM594_13750 [Niabella sp.]
MKRIKLTAFVMLAFALAQSSQAQTFKKGTNALNVGIGVGGNYGYWDGGSSLPQFGVSFEHGTWEIPGPGVISIGGYLGHKAYKYRAYGDDWSWSYTTIGARAAYHYTGLDMEKVDLYGGALLGYVLFRTHGYSAASGGGAIGAFAGGRYMFSPNFGVYAELAGGNYNLAILNGGITLKF